MWNLPTGRRNHRIVREQAAVPCLPGLFLVIEVSRFDSKKSFHVLGCDDTTRAIEWMLRRQIGGGRTSLAICQQIFMLTEHSVIFDVVAVGAPRAMFTYMMPTEHISQSIWQIHGVYDRLLDKVPSVTARRCATLFWSVCT